MTDEPVCRSTDRFITHRLGQFALATALIITIKLIKWADRWNPATLTHLSARRLDRAPALTRDTGPAYS